MDLEGIWAKRPASIEEIRWRVANVQDFGKILAQDPPPGAVVPTKRDINVQVAGPVGPC